MNFANVTAKYLIDTGLAPLFDSGTINLYTGSQPSEADDAATGTLLATIALPATAFAAASDTAPGATATANAIAQVLGLDAGTATYGRAFRTGGSIVICDLAVGSGIIITNPVIALNSPVNVTSFTLFQPES
jgi:hypothetical protein